MSSIDKPTSLAEIRWYALKRKLMWWGLANIYDAYLVAEFPKSGGTWFSQMLAEYLCLPFSRNTLPRTVPALEYLALIPPDQS